MEREGMIVYLRNLLALEMTKRKLEKALLNVQGNIAALENRMRQKDFQMEEATKSYNVAVLCFIIAFMCLLAAMFSSAAESLVLVVIFSILGIGCLACGLSSLVTTAGENHNRKWRNNEVRKHNQTEQELIQNLTLQLDQYRPRASFFNRELEKVKGLLQEAYGVNLLATPYRNLASVYYIYDYMTTSQASLSETLLHEHMESGIQRILEKLDQVVAQNEQMILSMRRLEAGNQKVIEQNQQMLLSMGSIESSALNSEMHSRLAASYAKSSAFFNAATYLEVNRRR